MSFEIEENEKSIGELANELLRQIQRKNEEALEQIEALNQLLQKLHLA